MRQVLTTVLSASLLCVASQALAGQPSDFGGGNSPLLHKHRYGLTLSPLTTCVNLNNSTIIANGHGEITGPVMNAAIGCPLTSVIPLMGNFVGGVWYPSIPSGSITSAMLAPGIGAGSVTIVPTRIATGASATTAAGDFLVCLNGPTTVQLENAPPAGTTHKLKDCRPSGGAAITVTPSGSDTIDAGPSITFTFAHQAMTVTYTALGWEVD